MGEKRMQKKKTRLDSLNPAVAAVGFGSDLCPETISTVANLGLVRLTGFEGWKLFQLIHISTNKPVIPAGIIPDKLFHVKRTSP
jgi:hypothetical protein